MQEPRIVCHLDRLMQERVPPLTAAKIAADTGVSGLSLMKLRRNSFVSIHAPTLAKLCAYLGVPLEQLLTVEGID